MSGTPSVPGMADSFKRSLRACDHAAMRVADLRRVVGRLDGVAERRRGGMLDWRYHGRLVARQLDSGHIVIRASFETRDFLVHSFPETFSVPNRFAKHMMVVADVAGNADAIEDAVIGAWEMQSGRALPREGPGD
jgi:hypothetical protein